MEHRALVRSGTTLLVLMENQRCLRVLVFVQICNIYLFLRIIVVLKQEFVSLSTLLMHFVLFRFTIIFYYILALI